MSILKSVVLGGICLASAAQARLVVSVEYSLSPAFLDQVLINLEKAARRANKDELGFVAEIFDGSTKTPVVMSCSAKSPFSDGLGCFLSFFPLKDPVDGEFRTHIQKPVDLTILKDRVKELHAKLAIANPAAATEHIHIGNPFFDPEAVADGTHYYCQASTDKKTWDCRLYVSDSE